ncbi:cupin domain-containing protein [Campylobacter jejuni]|nr:cupin domain-containing protein [Campylobacter jejuni]
MQIVEKAGTHGSFKGDAKIFSGEVKVNMMFKTNEWRDFSGGLVEFSKGTRSAWHTHPKGQTLIVIEGEIITKAEGQKAIITKKGDVISCPVGVKHFHGAANSSSGIHIALTGEINGKNVEWLELVSDEEYENALKEARE